jgi:cytochrome c-type biogenesis protein CcmH
MKRDLQRSALASAALTMSLVFAVAVSNVAAQEKPPLGPEVIAILGEPDRPGAGLDPGMVAVLGQPDGSKPDDSAVGARAAEIAAKVRCPVCQGVSIADSPSSMATNMRQQVRDLVARGYSEEQVMSYFERSYGEFVRLEPPMRGLNWMLWVLPAVVLMGGAGFVFLKARQPRTATAAPQVPLPKSDVDPALAKYLDRIRRDSGTSS